MLCVIAFKNENVCVVVHVCVRLFFLSVSRVDLWSVFVAFHTLIRPFCVGDSSGDKLPSSFLDDEQDSIIS